MGTYGRRPAGRCAVNAYYGGFQRCAGTGAGGNTGLCGLALSWLDPADFVYLGGFYPRYSADFSDFLDVFSVAYPIGWFGARPTDGDTGSGVVYLGGGDAYYACRAQRLADRAKRRGHRLRHERRANFAQRIIAPSDAQYPALLYRFNGGVDKRHVVGVYCQRA